MSEPRANRSTFETGRSLRDGAGDGSAPAPATGRSREPLGVLVAERLASAVREMSPGDTLPSEADLAEHYGVSSRIIRDALRTLSNQGIIATSQGKRATVAKSGAMAVEGYFRFATAVDRQAVAELFEVRLAMETAAASLAAERATSDELNVIRAAQERLVGAGTDRNVWVEANLSFHGGIVQAAGNRFFVGILDALSSSLRNHHTVGAGLRSRAGYSPDMTIQDHAAILDALQRRDGRRANGLMHDHLERVRARFLTLLELGPNEASTPRVGEDPHDGVEPFH